MFGIIDKLGGREAALEALNRRLPKPNGGARSIGAVNFWYADKAIPPRCAWVLRLEADERGIAFDPADYEFQPRQHQDAPSSEPVEKVA